MIKKILLDTDIGDEIDDAMALYFAMSDGIEIVGITTVYKNTDERARISKRLLKLFGRGYENVPVFAGHGTPVAEGEQEYPHTCHYHEALSSDEYAPDGGKDDAIDFIIDCCERYGEELAVVAIGPFTNIARAIEKNRAAIGKAGKVVIMGGAYYRQYADEDSEESREEVAHDGSSEPDKLFFRLEEAEAVMMAFENLNYRERAMISAHLGFCMECYATHFYDKDDLDEDGKPTRKPLPEEAFIDIAIDHGLASPDTADKTYRKALDKMKKKLNKQGINNP